MAWNNNQYRPFGGGNYQNYSFQKAGNQNRYQGGFSRAPYRQQKKHSGAKFGQAENPFVHGWKYDRRNGLRSFIAGPYKGKNSSTKRFTSKTGKEWENWAVKIQLANGQIIWKQCLYQVASRRVFINDMGLMMSPNSPNGGYIGPIKRKNNR